jgi:hypothetical protein
MVFDWLNIGSPVLITVDFQRNKQGKHRRSNQKVNNLI